MNINKKWRGFELSFWREDGFESNVGGKIKRILWKFVYGDEEGGGGVREVGFSVWVSWVYKGVIYRVCRRSGGLGE